MLSDTEGRARGAPEGPEGETTAELAGGREAEAEPGRANKGKVMSDTEGDDRDAPDEPRGETRAELGKGLEAPVGNRRDKKAALQLDRGDHSEERQIVKKARLEPPNTLAASPGQEQVTNIPGLDGGSDVMGTQTPYVLKHTTCN
jgi:hypothetical protein